MNDPGKEPRKVRIADLNDDDKPREKAVSHGIRSLSNAELLAIIFGGGLPGMSVVDMSRDILASVNNSLTTLARMSIGQMARSYKGIGTAKAVALAAAFELGGRCRDEISTECVVVRSSEDAFGYIRGNIENLEHEEFWIMILSRSNRIVAAQCVSRGGTAATVVDPKIIARTAIDHMASSVILAHNHPSGTLKPSVQDDALTTKIRDALALLDIRMLDHIIVAGKGYYSYSDNQRL